MSQLSQRYRLVILVVYVGLLFLASRAALGQWYPPSNQEGIWFYAGLASLLLGNLIVMPFFTKPADAIANGAAGLVAILTVRIPATTGPGATEVFWWFVVAYVCGVLMASTLAIFLRGQQTRVLGLVSNTLFRLVDRLGSPRPLFSTVFAFSLFAFHQESGREFGILLGTGLIVVALQPLETVVTWGQVLARTLSGGVSGVEIGELVARQEPGLMTIRQTCAESPMEGGVAAISTPNDGVHIGVFIGSLRLADETWLRYVCPVDGRLNEDEIKKFKEFLGRPGIAVELTATQVKDLGNRVESNVATQREQFVGIVAPDTSPDTLVFEVIQDKVGLEEGRLVRTRIRGWDVLYQTIWAVGREEILRQRNSYGYARGRARKVGFWNEDEGRFDPVKWIPLVNEPVMIVSEEGPGEEAGPIGYFPKTRFPVSVDLDLLVTHNTAILGILGIGKTMLALELVERIGHDEKKVIALDMTGQYADQLPLTESEKELVGPRLDAVRSVGAAGKENHQQNVEEGGSINEFREALHAEIERFIDPTNANRFFVINPNEFDVWRQDSKPFSGRASMASLTAVEITRIVAELTLEEVQKQGLTQQARVCLVFEEAHSLVPEWNSVATEGDKTAVNGTARAILQGRKYGLGCIVVTQRTANVTKSILNQCNTVFAMRVYDETGMEFLRNYIGADYASVLSALEDRHAVVYGRGSSCRDPVLVQLNDRGAFLERFRTED